MAAAQKALDDAVAADIAIADAKNGLETAQTDVQDKQSALNTAIAANEDYAGLTAAVTAAQTALDELAEDASEEDRKALEEEYGSC